MASAARKSVRPSYSSPASPDRSGNGKGGASRRGKPANDNRQGAANDNKKPNPFRGANKRTNPFYKSPPQPGRTAKPGMPSRFPNPGKMSGMGKYFRGALRGAGLYGAAAAAALELWDALAIGTVPVTLVGGGWTLLCTLPVPQYDRYREAVFSPGLACGTAGQTTVTYNNIGDLKAWAPLGTPDGGRVRWLAFGNYQPIGSQARMRLDIQYSRISDLARQPFGVLGGQPALAPYALPAHWPAVDPMAMPIAQPAPFPRAVPYPLIPHLKPDPRPEGSKRTTPLAPPTYRKPPPPGRPTKEKKLRPHGPMAGLLGAAAGLFGAATEAGDFIDALWDALPKGSRGKGGSMADKAEDLWNNWDDIDWNAAVNNLVQNAIEDGIIGGLHGKADAAGAKHGLSPGHLGASGRGPQVPLSYF